MCFLCQLTVEGQKSATGIAFLYSGLCIFPSHGASVLTAKTIASWSVKYNRRIVVRDKATDIRLYGLMYNILSEFIMSRTSLVKGP